MADEPLPDPATAPDLRGQAAQQLAGWLDALSLDQRADFIEKTTYNIVVTVLGFILKNAAKMGSLLGSVLADAENQAGPEFAKLASVAVQDLFGVPVTVDAAAGGRAGRTAAANAVGEMLFNAFSGAAAGGTSASGELQPSDVPAKNFLATMTQLSLEGWLEGWLVEAMSMGQLETFGELDDKISHTLGLGRAAAAVHGPIVKHMITTPLDWKLSKEHRPSLLSASACAKQIARDPANKEKWLEDLRRQGYSDARIDALLNEQRRFFSPSDVRQFVSRGSWTGEKGQKHLRDQGYDEDGATDALRLEGLNRIEQLEQQEANAIVGAYASGDIDRATMLSMLAAAVTPTSERTLLMELADVRRAANVKRLSLSQVEAMVRSKVLSVIDYRRAAEREGYPSDDVAALELHLRWELDKDRDLDRAREEQAKARADEKAARAADKAVKLRAVEAQRALERRGAESDLEAAAVRGLIPLGRVAEVYAAKYDPDTVQILLDELTDRRADYVEQQDRAAQARARAAVRRVDVGSVERAVLEHVLTLDQFRARLIDMQFGADDADLLTATLAARLADLEAAQHARDEAAAAAKVKHLDLGRLETLVRRGHRTLHDYDALLASLGYEDAARAAMVELLQLHIDDDAAAAQLRAAATAADAARGLSIEQLRRAVVLGIRPIADYTPFLLRQGFTTDAAAVLLAELQFDVDEAAAARARRATADRRSQAGRIPLADLRRAARLGLIDPTVYTARLAAEDYSDDEIAIELDLLTTEIGADRALQASADARAAAAPAPGLSLSQVAAAVVAGAAGIGDYTARALGLGFSTDDAATLTATLQAKLDALAAARARRDALAVENATRELSRADVEKSVRQGLQTLDDYGAWLVTAGYADDDAALLVAELATALDAGGAGGGTGG